MLPLPPGAGATGAGAGETSRRRGFWWLLPAGGLLAVLAIVLAVSLSRWRHEATDGYSDHPGVTCAQRDHRTTDDEEHTVDDHGAHRAQPDRARQYDRAPFTAAGPRSARGQGQGGKEEVTTPPNLLGGRYEVGRLLGRGGMAEVHLGYDTRLSRPVAIKMLRSDLARDTSFLNRFRREAQSAAGLNHAAIVAVYDSGEDHALQAGGASQPVPYIVMEYVEGRTLRELLNERSPLDPGEAARITEGILDALAYSHRMGIVHRDIKPANVMIGARGEIKVMDFGIARAVADANATMTQTQAVIGTAQYLSPEQAQGHSVDARSDLYSTGCLLFELLTGRPPFKGDSPVAIAYQHVGEAPPRPSAFNPRVSPALDAVVLHSLAKDREARYQDATAFRADLQAARLGRSDQRRRPRHRDGRERGDHGPRPAWPAPRRRRSSPRTRMPGRALRASPSTATRPRCRRSATTRTTSHASGAGWATSCWCSACWPAWRCCSWPGGRCSTSPRPPPRRSPSRR